MIKLLFMKMIASYIRLLYVAVQLFSHDQLFSKYLLSLFPSMKHFVGIKSTQTCLYNLASSHTNYLFTDKHLHFFFLSIQRWPCICIPVTWYHICEVPEPYLDIDLGNPPSEKDQT